MKPATCPDGHDGPKECPPEKKAPPGALCCFPKQQSSTSFLSRKAARSGFHVGEEGVLVQGGPQSPRAGEDPRGVLLAEIETVLAVKKKSFLKIPGRGGHRADEAAEDGQASREGEASP